MCLLLKKEFTTVDRVYAIIGRFSLFCVILVGGCMLAGLAIEESRRRNEPEDEDDDNEGEGATDGNY